jgi:hypothetical protein
VLSVSGNALANGCDSAIYGNLRKSEVFLFYAMAKGNSFSELNRAEHYLKLAESSLDECALTDSSRIELNRRISALQVDIDSRKEIGVDNLNYRYPFYDLLAGKRGDYNLVDDTHEVLLEGVLEQMISQPDPTNKGLIRNLGTFALVLGNIDDRVTYNVMVEYLSENTNHYVFQLFELEKLGYNLKTLAVDSIIRQSLQRELAIVYGFDELDVYMVNDIAELEDDNLHYSSCQLNRYYADDGVTRKFRYIEDFRSERNDLYSHLKTLLLLALVLVVIIIYLVWILVDDGAASVQTGSSDVTKMTVRWLSLLPEYIFSVGTSLFALFTASLIHYLLLDFLAQPTSFVGESVAILSSLWITAGVPITLFSVIFIIYRLRNTGSYYRRNQWTAYSVGFLLLVAGYGSLLYFKSPSDFRLLLFLLASITVVLASYNLCRDNRSFQALTKQHVFNAQSALSLLLIVVSVAQFSAYIGSEILQVALILLTGVNIGSQTIVSRISPSVESTNRNAVVKKSIFDGIEQIENVIQVLLMQHQSKVYSVQMPNGSGKTSLLKHLKNKFNEEVSGGSSIAIFGDCDKVVVDEDPFEPLREAFSDIGLDTVIYNRSGETVKLSVSKGLGTMSPIDEDVVGAALSWLSPKESHESIVSKLLDELKRKGLDKLLLIIDDYHLVDSESASLLSELRKQSELNKDVAVIIVLGLNSNSDVVNQDNEDLVHEQLLNFDDSVQAHVLERFLDDVSIETYPLSTNCKTTITALVNRSVQKTNLSVLSDVIENMFKEKVLAIEGGRIEVVADHASLHLEDFAKHDFGLDNYDGAKRQILQCAACMGRIFDKSLVASVLGVNAFHLIEDLDVLEKNQLVFDEPEMDQRYRFVSDTVRQRILRDMSPGSSISQRRRDYHKAIFDEIQSRANKDEKIFVANPHLYPIFLDQLRELGRLSDSRELAVRVLNEVFESCIANGNVAVAKTTMNHLVQLTPYSNERLVQEAELQLETSGTLNDAQYQALLSVVKDKTNQESSFSKLHVINLLVRSTGTSNHESKQERLSELKILGLSEKNVETIDAYRWRFYLNYFIQPDFDALKVLIDEVAVDAQIGDSYRYLYWEMLNAYGGSGLIDGRFNVSQNCKAGVQLVNQVLVEIAEQLEITVDELINRLKRGEMGNLSPKTQKTLCYSLNYLGRGYLGEGLNNYAQSVKFLQTSVVLNDRINDQRGLLMALSNLIQAHSGNSANKQALEAWSKYVELIPKDDEISLLFGLIRLLGLINASEFDDFDHKPVGQLILRIAEEVSNDKLMKKFQSEDSMSPLESLGVIFEKVELPLSSSNAILQRLGLNTLKSIQLTQDTRKHISRHFSEGERSARCDEFDKEDAVGSKFNSSFADSPEALIDRLGKYDGCVVIRGIEFPRPKTVKVRLELEFPETTGFDALVSVDSLDESMLETITRDGVKCYLAKGLSMSETKKLCIVIFGDLNTLQSFGETTRKLVPDGFQWALQTAWTGRYAPPLVEGDSFWERFAFAT